MLAVVGVIAHVPEDLLIFVFLRHAKAVAFEFYAMPSRRFFVIAMHFSLIDRIEVLEPGQKIVATKSLSLAEEYLRDHFPNFPVMPGVLMLEALTQASAWLVRYTDQFAQSIVVLKEAKSVKYARFVQPGQTLRLTASIVKQDGPLVTLKAEGTMEGQTNLKAHLILCRYNLADKDPLMQQTDEKVIAELKQRFNLLYREPVAS